MTPDHQAATATSRVCMIDVPVLSQAIRKLGVPLSLAVTADGLVFISGIPPIDIDSGELIHGDISRQCDASIKALKACLSAAGASTETVVSLKIYASNAGHYSTINDVYRRHFDTHLPARTFVPVGSWPGGFDIEIECIAVKSQEGPPNE